MRILVCGGRNYARPLQVYRALDLLHEKRGITCIIAGGARGADHDAGMWADMRKVPCEVYKADWEQHGKAAGPIRNQQMLDEGKPDAVVAFPGGTGTADMVRRAEVARLKVWKPIK